jgi:uncharacterized protein (TIGR02246 family)
MTNKMKLTALLATTGVAAASLALATPASASAKTNPVRAAYNGWVNAIQTANCQGTVVSSLYTKDGVLLATFNDQVVGRKAITNYFDGLTCNDELRVQTDEFTSTRDGDVAWATGLYTFSFNDDDGQRVEVPARYTFVFEKRKNGWKIANHHSSIRPESD